MEIFKHGKTFAEKKCDNCGAELGFTYRDIEHKTMTDVYNGKTHTTTTDFIYCPECGSRLVLFLTIDGNEHRIDE